jgi:hypothetical protein
MSFYQPTIPAFRFTQSGHNYSIHIVADDEPILIMAREIAPGEWRRVSGEWWVVQRDVDRDGGFDSWWQLVLDGINELMRRLFGTSEDDFTPDPNTLVGKVQGKIMAMRIVVVDGVPQIEVAQ